MTKCMRALFPKRNSGVRSVNPKPQQVNQLCNLDPLVFSYAVDFQHRDSHSQDYGMQSLVIHGRSSISSYLCNQDFRLSSKHNRSGPRPLGRSLSIVGTIYWLFLALMPESPFVSSMQLVFFTFLQRTFVDCQAKESSQDQVRLLYGP